MLVCKLLKALYGIKQAPHEWNEELNKTLVNDVHARRSEVEPCVYILKSKTNRLIWIGVFVDDILYGMHPDDETEAEQHMNIIRKAYKTSELGLARSILGLRVVWSSDRNECSVDQMHYILQTLKEFKIPLESRTMETPAAPNKSDNPNEHKSEKLNENEHKNYRALVGALMYMANQTRPDIMYAVGMLSRRLSAPTQADWIAGRRVLRYLIGTYTLGLRYRRKNRAQSQPAHRDGKYTFQITAYSDADWAMSMDDRKSTSGYVLYVNDNVVLWGSRKQDCVALSSAESEYVAESEATKEMIWTKQLIEELGFAVEKGMILYCDNKAAGQIARAKINGKRSKHIEVRYHYVREYVKRGDVDVKWIATDKQVADVFTKALSKEKFNGFAKQLVSTLIDDQKMERKLPLKVKRKIRVITRKERENGAMAIEKHTTDEMSTEKDEKRKRKWYDIENVQRKREKLHCKNWYKWRHYANNSCRK
jgi:hypothetical protein